MTDKYVDVNLTGTDGRKYNIKDVNSDQMFCITIQLSLIRMT